MDFGLRFAFEATEKKVTELQIKYEFFGKNDCGIEITNNGERVVIAITCRLDVSDLFSSYNEYDDEEYDEDDEDDEDDELLNLLVQVRQQLQQGDYRALHAVWEKYGDPEEMPKAPPQKEEGKEIVRRFASLLD